ncbi:hypothetical protein ADUPG1_012993 [Aduncisulcus paluster]|uniref:Uncharacterized protein n=1 Tax=Aduncisulcus paluster TaxID=2918883 RepID=A0ABQ5K5K7_9EUKA|nr:hypothetical protein ADUPG1_012993 [Aduncisulcus paluster]
MEFSIDEFLDEMKQERKVQMELVEELSKQKDILQQKVTELEVLLDSKNKKLEKIESESEPITVAELMDELKKVRTIYHSTVTELKQKLAQLQSDKDSLSFDLERMRAAGLALETRTQSLYSQLEKYDNVLLESRQQCETYQAELKEYKIKVKSMELENQQMTSSIERMDIEISSLKSSNYMLKKEVEKSKSISKDTKIDEIEKIYSEAKDILQAEIVELRKDLSSSQSKAKTLESELKTQTDLFKSSSLHFENTISSKETIISDLNEKNEELTLSNSEMKEKIVILENKCHLLTDQLNQYEDHTDVESESKLKRLEFRLFQALCTIEDLKTPLTAKKPSIQVSQDMTSDDTIGKRRIADEELTLLDLSLKK